MRNLMKLPVIAAFLSLPLACSLSATVDEPSICKTLTITSPVNIPSGASVPFTCSPSFCSYTENNIDFSAALSKLNSIANVSISVAQNQLNDNTDFNWLNSVEISVAPSANTMYPASDVTNQTIEDGGSSQLDLNVSVDPNTLESYFAQGPVDLTFGFSVRNSKNIPSTLSYTLCLSAEAKYNKSL